MVSIAKNPNQLSLFQSLGEADDLQDPDGTTDTGVEEDNSEAEFKAATKKKPKKVEIIITSGHHYDPSVKNGAEFISVEYSGTNYGYAGPCDTEEDVQSSIEHAKQTIIKEGDIPVVKDLRKQKILKQEDAISREELEAALLQEEEEVPKEVTGDTSDYAGFANGIQVTGDAPLFSNAKKNKETIALLSIKHTGQLDNTLSLYESFERNHRGISSSYGGHWGGWTTYDSEHYDVMIKEITEWKKKLLDMPFNLEYADDFIISGVKKDNIIIYCDNKSRQALLDKDIDIVKIMIELNEMPQRLATDELIQDVKRLEQLNKSKDEMRDKLYKMKGQVQQILDGKKLLIDKDTLLSQIELLNSEIIEVTEQYDNLRKKLKGW